MKFLYFLLLIISLPVLLIGQNIEFDEESGLYAQVEVLEFENRTKDDLFDKTIEWVTLNYNSANDVVQLNDKEAGKIIAKGDMVAPFGFGQTTVIRYTLIFDFKDERMRYTFTSFSWANGFSNPDYSFEDNTWRRNAKTEKLLNGHIQTAEENINSYLQSLVEYVNSDDSDDW